MCAYVSYQAILSNLDMQLSSLSFCLFFVGKSHFIFLSLLVTKQSCCLQVMTVGQKATFEFCGTNYIFTVNRATIADTENSKGLERGMLATDTYIVFEAPPNSGIKVYLVASSASCSSSYDCCFCCAIYFVAILSWQIIISIYLFYIDCFRRWLISGKLPAAIYLERRSLIFKS